MTKMLRKTGAFSVVVLIVFIAQLLLPIKTVASQPVGIYYATGYNLLGATAYISGAPTDLESDNGAYMTFRSYASQTSAQTLYAHQETTTIAGTSYYPLKIESADASGTSLNVSTASTGRQLWGKSVYQLTGVTSIPASTWTIYYRAWHSSVPEDIVMMNASFVPISVWSNPQNAYLSDDNYADTNNNVTMQPYGNYGFNIPAEATITKVEVGYEAYTEGDEKIGITLSWDGGTIWTTEYVSPPLGTTDPDMTNWVDFTSVTNWTSNKLSDANFYTRVKGIMTGFVMDKVLLDWIPVRVTYVVPPYAHADVDILIRKSDGTIRQTIATNVANSADLTTIAQTLSGVYSWSEFTVVEETDYLEIDYYLDVTTPKAGVTAYLRIDDNTLAMGDQTGIAGVMLPSEYTAEVEFTGTSNTNYWSKLVWTVDIAWTAANVEVTLQLYNYTLGDYPTTGNAYISYTSNATPNIDETKNQTITANLTHFRDSLGNWKIKVKGVKSTLTRPEFKADLIKLEATGDITSPVWSNAGTDSTLPGMPALFYVKWTDNVGLSGFVFGTNNTGTWKNDTWTPMSGTSNWSNATKTLNSTAGIVVQWRVWANDTSNNWNDTGTLSLTTLQPISVTRDVAVLRVTPSATEIYVGQVINVTVIAKNEGTVTETFNVTLYYNETIIGTKTVSSLAPNIETTLTFSWNTTGLTYDSSYTLKAEVKPILGETDTNDNAYTYGTVKVKGQIISQPIDWGSILTYGLPLGFGFLLALVASVIWKKRGSGPTEVGFEYFDEMTDGGIPDAYSIMIVGEASSGKSTLCQQLVHTYLNQGKACVYITYDCFPDEIRKNMKTFSWDTLTYEQGGTFKFIDGYSSIANVTSQEKLKIEDPFSLSDLGISMSAALEEVNGKSVNVFLDSTASLFTHVEPTEVIKFLEDRSAKIKGNNGVFFFTVGKGTVPSDLMRRLEEMVDSIIELEAYKENGSTLRKLCIRKMRGRRFHDTCASFNIKPPDGILFSLPKGWSKSKAKLHHSS